MPHWNTKRKVWLFPQRFCHIYACRTDFTPLRTRDPFAILPASRKHHNLIAIITCLFDVSWLLMASLHLIGVLCQVCCRLEGSPGVLQGFLCPRRTRRNAARAAVPPVGNAVGTRPGLDNTFTKESHGCCIYGPGSRYSDYTGYFWIRWHSEDVLPKNLDS